MPLARCVLSPHLCCACAVGLLCLPVKPARLPSNIQDPKAQHCTWRVSDQPSCCLLPLMLRCSGAPPVPLHITFLQAFLLVSGASCGHLIHRSCAAARGWWDITDSSLLCCPAGVP